MVENRGQILKFAKRNWDKGAYLKAFLVAIWVLVPVRWAQARQRRVERKKEQRRRRADP